MPFALSSPEERLILSLLFGTPRGRQEGTCKWHTIVRHCLREGVAAVVYYALKKEGLDQEVPGRFLQVLSEQFQFNLTANQALGREISALLTGFNERGVQHLLLKGIALVAECYPTVAMRRMADVDILVKKTDLVTIDGCLAGCGYEPADSDVQTAIRNPDGYLSSLEYHKKGSARPILHIHWHPVNTSVPASMFYPYVQVEHLWEKAVPVPWVGAKTRMLSPDHLLIYLCEHALRINHSFDRMILVYDIYRVLMTYRNRLDWSFIVRESRAFHLSDFVFFGLTIVLQFTGPIIPADVLDRLRPVKLTLGQRLFLYVQGSGHRIRGSSYPLYLAMNHGIHEKTRFILRTFFPPPPIQRQRIRGKGANASSPGTTTRSREIVRHLFGIITVLMRRRF